MTNRSVHCEIARREILPFPLGDLPLLLQTSKRFKRMLCAAYFKAYIKL